MGRSVLPRRRADGGGAQFADRNAYLTVDPLLKSMLDRLERSGDNIVLTTAQRLQSDPTIVNRIRETTGFRSTSTG